MLEKHGVHLVLNGHEHSYQRSEPIRGGRLTLDGDGIVYVTAGGGGAYLYPVYPSPYNAQSYSAYHFVLADVAGFKMNLRAIGLDGLEIDSFTLAPAPAAAGASIVDDVRDSSLPFRFVNITGRQLAAERLTPSGRVIPTEIGGTTVTSGGARLPLFRVAPDQITALLPRGVSTERPLRVVTPNGYSETFIGRSSPPEDRVLRLLPSVR